MISIYDLYSHLWTRNNPTFSQFVTESLKPRNPNILYDLFGQLGVNQNHTILDIGCRYANSSIELVKRFDCRAIAIDPIDIHIQKAQQNIAQAGLQNNITTSVGNIESLHLENASIEYIWCRDMLNHVVNLSKAFTECFRVLKSEGIMFIYVILGTKSLEQKEAQQLFSALSLVPNNMTCEYVEDTAKYAGFKILNKDEIGSEWREYAIENGETELLETLLYLSRMKRRKEELIHACGKEYYEASYAAYLWAIYQILGKVCPTVYILKK